MKNIYIIYWSGTGNTEEMAKAIFEGAKEKGEAKLKFVSDVDVSELRGADSIALGCPAMGDEVLEEEEFEPFMVSLEKEELLKGKPCIIFGSYEWNDGQWMSDWENRMRADGANLLAPGFAAYDKPDEEALKKCRELGSLL